MSKDPRGRLFHCPFQVYSKYILKASTARIVLRGNLSWLGKNITRHYLSKGFTMLFLLTVIAILVNELPRKMIRYQVIIFTQ